jgi:hypothetical protein
VRPTFRFLAALLSGRYADHLLHVSQWQPYCNELDPRAAPNPVPPIREPKHLRGFWQIRPDGTLSETGQ